MIVKAADLKPGDKVQTPRGALTIRNHRVIRPLRDSTTNRISMWFVEHPNPWITAADTDVTVVAR